MRLISIVCVEEKDKIRLLYYYDQNGRVKLEEKRLPLAKPRTESIAKVYKNADLFEREIHDFYGVEFAGNLNLHTNLFLPEEEKDHPMREHHA